MTTKSFIFLGAFLTVIWGNEVSTSKQFPPGHTKISKWQYGKKAAISLTFDDNTINQFRVAMPIMNQLGLHGTFYVITGSVPGSTYKPKFIGRPVGEIINETARIPTNRDNFFERASAVRFLGYKHTYRYHLKAGTQYEQGHIQKAYNIIDKAYKKVRQGAFEASNDSIEAQKALYNVLYVDPDVDLVTWDQLKKYQAQGHELGSHTISHPYLAVMDSVNMMYELQKSREEMKTHLGQQATFSAECPFGTEDPRVMHYAHKIYPALRNRMPEPWLDELDRSSKANPTKSNKEYVQWQRGPLSDTRMQMMKSWVDTALRKNNIWLVLVFHGIEGIGWEPLSRDEINTYLNYIKAKDDQLWVATFKKVTKYMRERMSASVQTDLSSQNIAVKLTHSLNPTRYDLPLTLKTSVPASWQKVVIKQSTKSSETQVIHKKDRAFIIYQAIPNSGPIEISPS